LPQYAESLLSEVGYGMAPIYALRSEGRKWIRAPRPELFDMKADPKELNNLYPDPDRLYAKLDAEMEKIFDDSKRRMLSSGGNPMNRETMEMLQSLGYLQGADTRKSMGGVDPKDGIVIFNRMEEARHLAQHDKWQEAEQMLRDILREHPENLTARSILALSLLRQNRLDEAQREYLQVLADDGDKARVYLMLATIALLRNDLAGAERYNQLALQASPDFVEAASNLGFVALLRGRDDEARKWYDKAIAIDPAYPHVYRRIADYFYDRKKFDDALVYYKKTLDRLPRDFRALLQAGNSARYAGDAVVARAYYERAQSLRTDSWLPIYNLACLEAASKEPDQAMASLRLAFDKGLQPQLVASDPDWQPLRRTKAFKELLAAAHQRAVREDD
jgi:tetratricopeptide (TPR) repeat protein